MSFDVTVALLIIKLDAIFVLGRGQRSVADVSTVLDKAPPVDEIVARVRATAGH